MKYGGEIRTELTSEVTHLIAVALCGSKVRQIMKKGLNDRSQYLVSPLWLEKSVAGGAREVETEHDPRRWLCGTDSAAVPAMQAFSSQFLAGMQFVIGKLRPESLDDPELRAAVVAQIEECGGEVLDEPRGVCVRIDNFCAELRGARAVRSRHWDYRGPNRRTDAGNRSPTASPSPPVACSCYHEWPRYPISFVT